MTFYRYERKKDISIYITLEVQYWQLTALKSRISREMMTGIKVVGVDDLSTIHYIKYF